MASLLVKSLVLVMVVGLVMCQLAQAEKDSKSKDDIKIMEIKLPSSTTAKPSNGSGSRHGLGMENKNGVENKNFFKFE